jgi:dihydroflavonol-4-reductase
MTNRMKPGDLCLVTGVSGYLASWMAKDLLEKGFRVRGTVRSLQDQEKIETMKQILPGVEFVPADLRSPEGWTAAVEGCQWVFHVASPQVVPTEKNRTEGATKGTEYLMRAALAQPSVQKIVITSSEAAIAYGLKKTRFNEDDWTDLDGPAGQLDYFRSKTLAERLAWTLAGDATANPGNIPLATVNPGFIVGPTLVPWGRYSMQTVKDTMEGRTPFLLDMVGHVVDVRDCARMHIAVMNDPTTNGRRHLSFAMVATMKEQATVLQQDLLALGLKPTQRVAPKWLIWMLKFFVKDAGSIYDKLGHENLYVTKWPEVYRYEFTDLRRSMKDTLDRMLELGWITPLSKRNA